MIRAHVHVVLDGSNVAYEPQLLAAGRVIWRCPMQACEDAANRHAERAYTTMMLRELAEATREGHWS